MLFATRPDAGPILLTRMRAERDIHHLDLIETPVAGARLVAGCDQPHLCLCMHIDDRFVVRACVWAAVALVVMAIAGLLP